MGERNPSVLKPGKFSLGHLEASSLKEVCAKGEEKDKWINK